MRAFFIVTASVSVLTISACNTTQNWQEQAANILNSDVGGLTAETLSGASTSGNLSALTSSEISAGLREALKIGTENVSRQLGAFNGFNLDPKIRIPLPDSLQRVDTALSALGMNNLTNELELSLNRAAEAATPKAKALFVNAISQMTIEDAKQILTGNNTAATDFLRQKMGANLAIEMQPLVQSTLASTGAIKAYDAVIGQYSQIPFVPDVKANLNAYVVEKAMDGIFYYVGQEEAAIRANPAARTTDLLKKVFSK